MDSSARRAQALPPQGTAQQPTPVIFEAGCAAPSGRASVRHLPTLLSSILNQLIFLLTALIPEGLDPTR